MAFVIVLWDVVLKTRGVQRVPSVRSSAKSRADSVFQRHRRKAIVLTSLAALLLLGTAAELILRLMGFTPSPAQFPFVKELQIRDDYVCDEKGIAKLNPAAHFPEGVSVNKEGFRDRDFDEQLAGDRPRIMFVGDSFTYGFSASPITNCFADRIETCGYTAFNFGIPSVGPEQYAAVVEKYLPIVQPDMLAVMVFLGNDVNWFPWKMQPYQLPFYSTNVGQIYAYDRNGNRMTATQAYQYYCGGLRPRIEYYARKSVLFSLLGREGAGLRRRLLLRRYRTKQSGETSDINQYAIDSFRRIDSLARSQGVPCRFFIIPAKPGTTHSPNSFENVAYVFEGLEVVHEDFGVEDYATGSDVHLNNAGHEKMKQLVRRTFEQLPGPISRRPPVGTGGQ